MMSRKDFIQIAERLARIENDDARKTATEIQISVLRNTNPRFDEQRFRSYVETHARKFKLGY